MKYIQMMEQQLKGEKTLYIATWKISKGNTEWKKQVSERYTWYDAIYVNFKTYKITLYTVTNTLCLEHTK